MQTPIDTVVFDLGGVLVDWNPEYLYRKVFETEDEMQFFLKNICTSAWNGQQDAGRPLEEATNWLVERHPEFEPHIRMYYGRWEEMLGGPIHDTVILLQRLHQQKSHRLLALTNWSQETFPIAQERYDFLQLFEGILVSGEEKLIKPDAQIYQLLIDRYQVDAPRAIFIDDNTKNVEGAKAVGLQATHYQSPQQLERELTALGILQ